MSELYGYTIVIVNFKKKEITTGGTYYMHDDAVERVAELEADNYYPGSKIVIVGSEIWFPSNIF